jgi:hypothetical protein
MFCPVGDLDPTEPNTAADALGVTPSELVDVARAMAELSIALRAFIVTAESLYPHLTSDLKLRRALRAWRGETSHKGRGETHVEDDGLAPTDP